MSVEAKNRVDQLTEKQKDCLRLVAEFKTSKEIGKDLGITHHSVDKRLKLAVHKLGVQSRVDAAKLLIAHERDLGIGPQKTYGRTVRDRPDLPIFPSSADQEASDAEWSPAADDGEIFLLENQKFNTGKPVETLGGFPSLAALLEVDRKNRLSVGERTIVMALIMIGFMVAFTTLIVAGERLSQTFYRFFT